jgi:hypothetical protein
MNSEGIRIVTIYKVRMELLESLNTSSLNPNLDSPARAPINSTEISTTMESITDHNLAWTWPLCLKSIIFTSIILCTIIGNLMVLLSIGMNRTLRSPTYTFIGNLALADFLVGILVLPCNATSQISGKWYFGPAYCVAWASIHLWLCSASILSICAICLDRYIGVSRPLKHFRLMRGRIVGALIGGVWTLAFCLGVIPVFVWPEPQDGGKYSCKFNSRFGLVLVVTIGIFYIPMSTMILLYWKIYRTASSHLSSVRDGRKELRLSNESVSSLRIHVGGRGGENRASTYPSSISIDNLISVNMSRQTKAAKKLTVVVGAFILCYFPFFTVFLIQSLKPGSISNDLFNVLGWIRYFNSCLNPMIYAATLPAFRDGFKRIICCGRC